MYKKFIALILVIILMVSMTACSQTGNKEALSNGVVSPNNINGQTEITIVYYAGNQMGKYKNFTNYVRKFEQQYGVKVNLKPIGAGNWSEIDEEDAMKKIFTELYVKDGTEIICNTSRLPILTRQLITGEALVDLRDKVPNFNKVYDALLEEKVYYAPIGISAQGSYVNQKILDELGIEKLGLEWEHKDYLELRDKWRTYKKRYFTANEYYYTLEKYLMNCKILDVVNKKANLNTPEVKNALKNTRDEIFSSYLLDNTYKYENYYNLLFVPFSKEGSANKELCSSEEYREQSLWGAGVLNNSQLYAQDIQTSLDRDAALIPEYKEFETSLGALGLMVNRNGKNLELAYEFINGFLENDVQMSLFDIDDSIMRYYPVNKDIESKIIEKEQQSGVGEEAMLHKKYLLDRIKQGKVSIYSINSNEAEETLKVSKIYKRFYVDMAKFVFADAAYSENDLSAELKKLENEYSIWLNE